MSLTVPDWLTRRGGNVKLGSDQQTWFVTFDDKPHYSLRPVPAAGKHGCAVRQTENGRRFDHAQVYDTPEAALRGGLDGLGKELGWTG